MIRLVVPCGRFATTIHILVSAVVKLTRAEKLPAGLELYRGLGGSMALPDEFYKGDGNGCRGYTEWGFLSTTSNRATAVEVSCYALRVRTRIHCTPCYSMSGSSAATACRVSLPLRSLQPALSWV
jgi:hypothetical protein